MTGLPVGPAAEAARIARSQESMITRAQLRAAGVSRHAIAAHVANGWLVRRHRSVYQLGVACGHHGDEMAALLACGPHAALGHWTGAWVFELCQRAGLPAPRMNVRRAGWEVDAVWDDARLVVEVDGYRSHGPKPQFERDRRKDADLMLAGHRVLRITWQRLTSEPMQVAALLATTLSR